MSETKFFHNIYTLSKKVRETNNAKRTIECECILLVHDRLWLEGRQREGEKKKEKRSNGKMMGSSILIIYMATRQTSLESSSKIDQIILHKSRNIFKSFILYYY